VKEFTFTGSTKLNKNQSEESLKKKASRSMLHCLPIDIEGLDYLTQFDGNTGALSARSAIISLDDESSINYLIYTSRSNFALQQAFFGNHSKKKIIKIRDLSFPEEFIFERNVDGNILGKGFTEKILKQLVKDNFFKSSARVIATKSTHIVELNQGLIKRPPEMFRKIFFSAHNDSQKIIESGGPLSRKIDFPKLNTRIKISEEFRNKIMDIDLVKLAQSLDPKSQCLRNYCNSLNIPTVGVLRGYPDQTVFYLLSHFKSNEEHDISIISNVLSSALRTVYESEHFKSFLVECSRLCSERESKSYTSLLVSKPPKRKNVCVFGITVFDKNLNTCPEKNSLILRMREYAQEKLKWQTWCKRGEYFTTFV